MSLAVAGGAGAAALAAKGAAGASAGASSSAWIGPAIMGGSSLLGGLFARDANQKNIERQMKFQEDFAKMGVQWRVADAKAAGLHPLYAMGANLPMPTPMVIGDTLGPALADAGQAIGNAVARTQSEHDRQVQSLEFELLAAQVNKTRQEASYMEALAYNELNPKTGVPGIGIQSEVPASGQVPVIPGNQPGAGMIDLKAADQMSAKQNAPGVMSGRHPAYQVFDMNGRPFVAPWTGQESLEEALESMSMWDVAALINRNRRFFGDQWFKGFMLERKLGIKQKDAPTMKYWDKAMDLHGF